MSAKLRGERHSEPLQPSATRVGGSVMVWGRILGSRVEDNVISSGKHVISTGQCALTMNPNTLPVE